ncbi:hypothetical protein R8510_03957 [Ralstonia chuxiongensis]|jgi:hypothetical protein|nr:hypothetical protein R8510_03957 [Ralstonia chuxiongensis]
MPRIRTVRAQASTQALQDRCQDINEERDTRDAAEQKNDGVATGRKVI